MYYLLCSADSFECYFRLRINEICLITFYELFVHITFESTLFGFGIIYSGFIVFDLDSCNNTFMLYSTRE